MNDKISRFFETIGQLESTDRVAIFTHQTPDPDALGAAVGVKWILKKQVNVEADIFYTGEISHPQNKTMVNILGIQTNKIIDVDKDYDRNKYALAIAVDTTTDVPISVDYVIDHHRNKETKAEYIIDPVGATCTIICEMIEQSGMVFDDDIDQCVATALLLGIKVDTDELVSETTTDRDYKASQYLSAFVDRGKLSKITRYPLPGYILACEKVMYSAENNIALQAGYVGFVGSISATQRDVIPYLADKMIRVDGIDTSIVFAIVNGSRIEGSVRSTNSAIDVNDLCRELFNGGGKLGSGAGRVNLGFLEPADFPDEDMETQIVDMIKTKMFHKIKCAIEG